MSGGLSSWEGGFDFWLKWNHQNTSNAPGRGSHPPGAGMLPKLEFVKTLGVHGSSLTWKTLFYSPWSGICLSTAWSMKYENTHFMQGNKYYWSKSIIRMIQKLELNQSNQLRKVQIYTWAFMCLLLFLFSSKRHSNAAYLSLTHRSGGVQPSLKASEIKFDVPF